MLERYLDIFLRLNVEKQINFWDNWNSTNKEYKSEQIKNPSKFIYDLNIHQLDILLTVSRFDYKSCPIFCAHVSDFKISQSEEIIDCYQKPFLFDFNVDKFSHYDSFDDFTKSNPNFTIINDRVKVIMKITCLQKENSPYKYGDVLLTFDLDGLTAHCNKYCYGFFNYIIDMTT